MGIVIYTRKISGYMKEEYIRRFRIRRSRIQISGRIFIETKERIWRRR